MISRKKLHEHLEHLSKEELIKEIEKLFQKISLVQQYYSMDLGEDSTALLEEYKKKMEKVFFPRGFGVDPKMSEANKLIKEFSKISVHVADTIDLMLYKVELSIKLFETWGYEFPVVANSFSSTYDKIVDLIQEHHLKDHFKDRCIRIEYYGNNFYLLNKTL